MPRSAALILLLPLLVGACVVVSEGPELPTCATTVTQEPTGDLAVDLVGAWKGRVAGVPGQHPIAYMASTSAGDEGGRRVWIFREDGTGHVWWRNSTEDRDFGNEEEFVWEVVDGHLVVNDFPPATMDIQDAEHLIVHPVEEGLDPSRGVRLIRCDPDIPEGVRGFK
jgi:hypothetical protein